MHPEEVLLAIARGDVSALKKLYEQFRLPVFAIAYSIAGNKTDAEDILQETFIRIYEKASLYRPGTNPKAWIIAIARHLAYDAMRRGKRLRTEPLDSQAEAVSQIESASKLELMDALLQLEESERQIIVLYLLSGFKHAEISELLNLPPGTVRWKYRKGLRRLSLMIGGEKNEPGNDRL